MDLGGRACFLVGRNLWLSWNLYTENTEFQEYITEVQVLNTTAIESDYAGRDPQGGTSEGSFL